MKRLAPVLLLAAVLSGCNCGDPSLADGPDTGHLIRPDADEEIILVPADSGVPAVGADAGVCENPTDLQDCPCSPPLAKRPCYTSDPRLPRPGPVRGRHPGVHPRRRAGLLGPLRRREGPQPEVCADRLDHNCNGLTGCADPACKDDPVCLPGGRCSDPRDLEGCPCPVLNQARVCFAGPSSSRNVGACTDGSQLCVQSGELQVWSPCAGGILPGPEGCTDQLDNDCDGATDCLDSDCRTAAPCVPECQRRRHRPLLHRAGRHLGRRRLPARVAHLHRRQ
jgi:hypothetical protein